MTMNITELEIIESLDFEFEPPCESLLGCDKTAVWRTIGHCCDFVVLLCEEEFQTMKEFMATPTKKYHLAPMGGCGGVFTWTYHKIKP